MKRRRLTAAQKAAIIARQVSCCGCGCGGDLTGQAVEFDHMLPLALGGADVVENLQALLVACHRSKSRDDVRRIRKADRQRKHHETGRSRARKGPPMRSRGFSGWRRFDGQIVRNDGPR